MVVRMTNAPSEASPNGGPDPRVFVVVYLEFDPTAIASAAALLEKRAAAGRQADGNLRFDVLQQRDLPNHLVAVTAWRDEKSLEADRQATHTSDFKDNSAPLLISAIDARVHTVLVAGDVTVRPSPSDVCVVTHVDVPPPHKDTCVELLITLADQSRDEPGCLQFDILQQTDRPNHFSVVQIWKRRDDYDAHIVAGHATAFRRSLTPISGAPYDERLYVLLTPG